MLKKKNTAIFHRDLEMDFDPKKPDIVVVRIKEKNNEIIKEIDAKDLFAFSFLIAKAEEALKMLPTKTQIIHKYVRQHKAIAEKDIKKGEEIILNCKMYLPYSEEEIKGFNMTNETREIKRSVKK